MSSILCSTLSEIVDFSVRFRTLLRHASFYCRRHSATPAKTWPRARTQQNMSTDPQPTHAASAESESHTHVVAVDGSEDADRAFRWALRNLPKNDRLVLVHGLHVLPVENPHMDWMDQATTLTREERARIAKERHRALFSHYEKRCKEAGRTCTFETVKWRSTTELAHNLCKLAEDDKASTVLAGSRGLGLYDRVMLGSVSTAMLNRCRMSVFIARDDH